MKTILTLLLTATLAHAASSTYPYANPLPSVSHVGELTALNSILPPTYQAPSNSLRSITHADVIFVPDGWGSRTKKYRYWMLATPFPKATLEDPCVFFSHDGYQWGNAGNNPIHSNAEAVAMGYEWQADTDLVIASNKTMQAYWMAFTSGSSPKSDLLRSESGNGLTWSAPTAVLELTGASSDDRPLVSPAVVVETNGNLTMFYTKAKDSYHDGQKIAYRTSTDNGDSWSSETACVYETNRNAFFEPWNINVTKVNQMYYGIVKVDNLSTQWRQYYGYSSNKTDWYFDKSPAFYQTGLTNLDSGPGGGVYRTALIAKSAMPLVWDAFVSGAPDDQLTDASFPGSSGADQPWLIYRVENCTFPMAEYRIPQRTCIFPPLSAMNAASAAVWWGVGAALGNRFEVVRPTRIRYINFELAVSSGNIEVGICRVDPDDTAGLDTTVIITSGVIASPGTGAQKVDLGDFYTIGPGHYILYFWADNTTISTYHTSSATAASLAGTELGVYLTGITASGGYAITPTKTWQQNTDRALTGFSITDY